MRVLAGAGWMPTIFLAIAVDFSFSGVAWTRGVFEGINPSTDAFVESSQVESVLDQLGARDLYTDHDLILRLEIELLCLANPDERAFLLAYIRHQISPPSRIKARLR